MKIEAMKSDLELFICNHEDCADRGSKELTSKLKKWCKERDDKRLKIYRSGCLGKCSEGIAMVLYPEKAFFVKVKSEDLKEIKHLLTDKLQT